MNKVPYGNRFDFFGICSAFFVGVVFVAIFKVENSWGAASAVHGVFRETDELGPDIPPVGSSYFDKLFYNESQGSYEIPQKVPDLIRAIELKTSGQVSTSPFFYSRSLQRPVDLSFNPLKHPRLVFSNSRGAGKGQIFVGFLAPKDQIEVISYNEEMGRFEFQIVSNLSSRPKVSYAVRAKCMTCHQNQGPIFPVAPWGDTFSADPNSFKSPALALLKDDQEYKEILNRLNFLGSDFGNIDNDVRTAEGHILFQRLWVHGCDQSRECRFHILAKELGLGEYLPETRGGYSLEALIRRSELGVLKSADSKISGLSILDPFVFQELRKLNPALAVRPSESEMLNSVKMMTENPNSQNEIIELLKNLPAHDSPSASRAMSMARQYHSIFSTATAGGGLTGRISGFFNDSSAIGRAMSETISPRNLAERLKQLYLSNSELFSKRPFILRELVEQIANAQERTRIQGQALLLPAVRPKVFNVSESPVPTFFSVEPLNVMIRHCGQCHQGSGSFPPQFLAGSEDSVYEQVKSWRNRILRKLQSRAMPPSTQLHDQFENSGDRQKVLNWLNGM